MVTYTDKQRKQKRDILVFRSYALVPLGINAKDGYSIIDTDSVIKLDGLKFRLSNGYAVRSSGDYSRLHHLIVGKPAEGMVVDHINGNKLDNRIKNLRFVTYSQNMYNRRKQSNSSGFKGVSRNSKNRYRANIKHNRVNIYLGVYETPEQAAKAYDKAAKEYFGEYAYLNFPNE